MFDSLYDLYLRCFPDYPTSEKLFLDLLRPDLAHIIYKYDNKKLIGFSLIHGNTISLICVDDAYRNKGYGSQLLINSEKYISDCGERNVVLGRGKYYLLQGVPADDTKAVSFFKHRDYVAEWTSVNMILRLGGFDATLLTIPQKPDSLTFRFANDSDTPLLLDAITDAKPEWRGVFEACIDPIMLAIYCDKIVGFEILSENGGRFKRSDEKVGCIGCVGTINSARRMGIGRQMVVAGIEWLKKQGCASIELRYVELVNWYEKIGFEVTRRQWMGEKLLSVH